MIAFEQGENRFNYPVVGIAIHEDQVLLHQAAGDSFWTLPGGRAELGEPAEQTLKREMIEELAVAVEIVRRLWLVENFFNYDGKNYHEIALYFLMQFPNSSKYLSKAGPHQAWEGSIELVFKWFPLKPEVLAGLPLLPSFLQTALRQLPDTVQHVVHYD
jgi:8-oxo-dGTP pyrophosphatase MutT (NUDIX family)